MTWDYDKEAFQKQAQADPVWGMEQTILTPWQETVLKLVNEKRELADFYLSGETALDV